jgi:RimJ/RimL family protein N-acetyltransferase
VKLRPPRREDSGPLLAAVGSGDPALWEYLPYGPFGDRDWAQFLDWCIDSEDPRFYVVAGVQDGPPLGWLSMLRADTLHGSVEIGHVVFGAALQRTPGSTEAIYLAAKEAFEVLENRRLEWKCDSENQRSRRAAERFGFRYEGTFRQHMVVKGRSRDSAWFSIIDEEWPLVRSAVQAWLALENFDAAGRQRRSLASIREPLGRNA